MMNQVRKRFFLAGLLFFVFSAGVFPGKGFAQPLDPARIQKEAAQFDGVYDVIVIKGKKDILVTYKVEQFKRFRKKKIEKQIKEALKKTYPDGRFTVSSDFKIHLEAKRLVKRVNEGNMDKETFEKELKQIVKLEKDQA